MPSLSRDESRRRAGLLSVTAYDVSLDLSGDDKTFTSRSRIRLTAHRSGDTFVEVRPRRLVAARLDGSPLDVDLLEDGRLH